MLNVWDWELLANPSDKRLEEWGEECRRRCNVHLTYDDLDARHRQLLENPLFYAIAHFQEFWLYWVWVVKYRLFRTWYQDLNEDKRHWVHGRGLIYLLMNDQHKIDTYNCVKFSGSWTIPSSSYRLEVAVGGEDDGVMLSFACGFFCVWIGIENIIPKQWARKISKYDHERVTGISFHHGSIWLAFWRDEYGYADWKGVHFSFDFVEFLLGSPKHSKLVLLTDTVNLELPEGQYRVDAVLYEATWKRPRNPFPIKLIKCELSPSIPIPIPGKGENSYDIDDDAIYGMTTAANSVDEAIAHLRDDVIETRKRYGGDNWQPEGVAYGL